jgi:aspartate aminotransferase-like enzyme
MLTRQRASSAASTSDSLVDIGTSASIRVKVACEPWEFDQIHRLNYRTFVEEIPQHHANAAGVLIDKFDRENTYIIAVDGKRVLGMIAVRDRRPFSLDAKLSDLDAYLPPARRVCEFRLLAVDKPHRAGRLMQQLIAGVWSHCRQCGYDLAVMSGTTRQLKLYNHLGFVSFGPLVGEPGAQFQPMMLTRAAAQPVVRKLVPTWAAVSGRGRTVNLLPGPVPVRPEVQRALGEPAASHRSQAFAFQFASTQSMLRDLTSAAHVQLLLGSGTLANDAVAGQLSLGSKPGVILSNGEFGERLVDHANRFGLACEVMRWPWGRPFEMTAIEHRLGSRVPPAWLWFVHLETSTGVLNDLAAIKTLCACCGVELCVDAISSLGTVRVDLDQVRFATTVSGKGLGAFPGVAIVFHDRPVDSSGGRLPRYLDLELYAREDGVPFTHSSNLIGALHMALQREGWEERFRLLAGRSRWLRGHLRRRGFDVVAPESHMAPGVVTIALPPTVRSADVGAALDGDGFAVAANSDYLRRRNWIQISVMAEPPLRELRRAVDALCRNAC